MKSITPTVQAPVVHQKIPKEASLVEVISFMTVVVLWVGFGAALLFSQSTIDGVWEWFKAQSLVLQIPIGIVLLPWFIGIWMWETSWPLLVRAVLVAGLAWANLYVFFPWRTGE